MIGKARLEYEQLMAHFKTEELTLQRELNEAAQNLEFQAVFKAIANVQNYIETLSKGCTNDHDRKCIEQANCTLATIPGRVQTAQGTCDQSQAISAAQKNIMKYYGELRELLPKIGQTADKCINKKPKCIIDCVATELAALRKEMFDLQSNLTDAYRDIRNTLDAQNRCVKKQSLTLELETLAIQDSLLVCINNK